MMWTSCFIVLAVVLLALLAVAYEHSLFDKRDAVNRLVAIAGAVALATAYCGYRAFW